MRVILTGVIYELYFTGIIFSRVNIKGSNVVSSNIYTGVYI